MPQSYDSIFESTVPAVNAHTVQFETAVKQFQIVPSPPMHQPIAETGGKV